ncbi:MAG: hypothetical protein LAN64_02405 [Acidobacteriia bacterium]|nr:hypothetical protein [Terriglobia bacterium]
MKLTIDNFDGAGARDYTAALDVDCPPRVRRRLNRPAELRASLVAGDAQFVVPTRGAGVVLARNDGEKIFTGYLTSTPEYEYLGWGARGPVYRYALRAAGDEFLLDNKTLPQRAPFTHRAAGNALKQLAEDLQPGAFDGTGVEDLAVIPSYFVDSRKPWSEHAAGLALLSRASYRAHDGQLFFRPIGATEHALDEAAPLFCPDALRLSSSQHPVNDVTVVGYVEPRAYVKDYFLGDGYTLHFYLSEVPYGRSSSLVLDEEYAGSVLRPTAWLLNDPAHAVAVTGGELRIEGNATVRFAEAIELGGALLLRHGDISFTAPSDGAVGGLYTGAVSLADCFAGFRVTPSGAQSVIAPIVNGSPAGTTMTTIAGHRYVLTTRIYASEIFRRTQTFHSSLHPVGSGRGGAAIAAAVRVILEAHDLDPNNPSTIVSASTVLFDAYLPAAPDFCTYALLDGASLHASLAFTSILRAVDAEVRSCPLGGSYRGRLVGALSDGAESHISSAPELSFYPTYVPAASEKIVVSYRSAGRAIARLCDTASIAANATDNDDGMRGAVVSLTAPPARTTDDCEQAALAFLDDSTQPAWSGEYAVWSNFLPGAAADVLPGDALAVNVPSRGAAFRAIVREVEIEAADLAGDAAQYTIKFSTDFAEPFAFQLGPAANAAVPAQAATAPATGAPLTPLTEAEVIDVTSTSVMIDTHGDPPAGGGLEVRRSDTAWGADNDRNLIGRYTEPVLFLSRLSRVQDFYIRQYDASVPPRYSQYSVLLHVDYPW